MRTELSRALPLVLIFALGLGAGIWAFISPWVLTYPVTNGWSSSVWSGIWVGVIVAGLSGASAVVVLARALHITLNRIQPASRNQREE